MRVVNRQLLRALRDKNERLEQSNDYLVSLVDALPYSVFVADLAGRVQHANPACVTLLDEDPTGTNLYELFRKTPEGRLLRNVCRKDLRRQTHCAVKVLRSTAAETERSLVLHLSRIGVKGYGPLCLVGVVTEAP